MDWEQWHRAYDEPGSKRARRLEIVRERVSIALDGLPPGPGMAISMCAGQGRDLLPVLAIHPRGRDVRARLVELDERNVAAAQAAASAAEAVARAATPAAEVVQGNAELGAASGAEFVRGDAAAGLDVEIVQGDAGLAAAYAGLVPADLVLVAGVLGNLIDTDVRRTVAACAAFCKPGGSVVWTRHRDEPDPVPVVCGWFEELGFERIFLTEPSLGFSVGVHRQTRPPVPFTASRIFSFIGSDVLRGHRNTGS